MWFNFFFVSVENTRYIKDLLDRFEDPRQVPNWINQGSIILDYLDITAKVRKKTKIFYLLLIFNTEKCVQNA